MHTVATCIVAADTKIYFTVIHNVFAFQNLLNCMIFHNGGDGGGPPPAPPPIPFFVEPPIKADAPHGAPGPLKNDAYPH